MKTPAPAYYRAHFGIDSVTTIILAFTAPDAINARRRADTFAWQLKLPLLHLRGHKADGGSADEMVLFGSLPDRVGLLCNSLAEAEQQKRTLANYERVHTTTRIVGVQRPYWKFP